MKKNYIVARNAFTVDVAAGGGLLTAWEAIEPRFRPFEAQEAGEPVLEAEVTVGVIPQGGEERIYDPGPGSVGFITGYAMRGAGGATIMEFRHVDELQPRLRMTMPEEFDRAAITIRPGTDRSDADFLAHALMIAFMLATLRKGTLLIHASAVMYAGKAYLFQGKSGTGKSTHAALWTGNIPGAVLLNDDNPLISCGGGMAPRAYGSPWSGKTPCYRNLSAPIGALVRIVRDKDNFLRRLDPLRAYASLTASVFYLPFLSEELRAERHRMIERLACEVVCAEMHCRPDADAALTCCRAIASEKPDRDCDNAPQAALRGTDRLEIND